jgi:putative ABC transport system permease protein
VEMNMQGNMAKSYNAIRQDLISTGGVANVGLADHDIINGGNNSSGLVWDAKPAGTQVLVSQRYITPEFMETAGLKLIEGRKLLMNDTAMPMRIVITETMAKLMGKGSALGKKIHGEHDTTSATVVGVVNDYVYGNMYGKPDPVMFWSADPIHTKLMYVRLKANTNIEKTLSGMQAVMKKDNPAYPFDYRFVDEQFNQVFQTESLVSKLSKVFAALAIVISCLGLFGLAAYTAERRTKEIGIRKVLGASVSGLAGLLSKDFLQLVIASCVVAFPIAYWMMQNWLKKYEYHIAINWWVFVGAGIAAVIIALGTVSFQSIKAAIANPVKSLRSE